MTPFENNLSAIQEHHPELLALLRKPISTSHLTIVPTKSGAAQLVVTSSAGDALALHNPENPLTPIQRTALQIKQNLKGVTVVLGFELGYLAKMLCHALPSDAALVFYEADPAIFLMALNIVDLTDVLSHPRVALRIGPQATLHQACAAFLRRVGGPLRTTAYGPSLQLAPTLYHEIIHHDLSQISRLLHSSERIVEWDGALLTENIFENIPHVLQAPDAATLQHAFQDIPAILVAAGPSLAKNVSCLRDAKGRSVIVAADTALRYLLENGVIPDFVVSIDPQETTSQKYADAHVPEGVTLLFHPATHHRLVKEFPGPKLTMDIPLAAYEWLRPHWKQKGRFDHDATCQIHVGFNLAAWMGCTPLVLVGHDLCFTDQGMHAATAGYLNQSEEDTLSRGGRTLLNQEGQPVTVTATLEHDKLMLEKKIRDFHGTVVNATEGGLAIEGALSVRLADVLAEYGRDRRIDVKSAIQRLGNDTSSPDMSALRQDIHDRLRDLFRIERIARQVCRLLTRIKDQRHRSNERDPHFFRMEKQVEQLTREMPRYSHAQALLCGMAHRMTPRLDQDAFDFKRKTDPQIPIDQQIDRDLGYYTGLLAVMPRLRCLLSRLSNRLKTEQAEFEHPASDSKSATKEMVSR